MHLFFTFSKQSTLPKTWNPIKSCHTTAPNGQKFSLTHILSSKTNIWATSKNIHQSYFESILSSYAVRHNRFIYSSAPDTSYCEEEIIRNYGKRWQIEVFFKTCKSYLNLISECHSLSYDALTAHVAIVFARYMLLALEQQKDEDNRTLGKIFFSLTDELADITFGKSLQIILKAMFEGIYAVFQVTNDLIDAFINIFVEQLPDFLQKSLARSAT